MSSCITESHLYKTMLKGNSSLFSISFLFSLFFFVCTFFFWQNSGSLIIVWFVLHIYKHVIRSWSGRYLLYSNTFNVCTAHIMLSSLSVWIIKWDFSSINILIRHMRKGKTALSLSLSVCVHVAFFLWARQIYKDL